MNLLENELVKKYFGCRAVCTEAHFINVDYDQHERCMSCRILQAMQDPIKKGDLVLCFPELGTDSIEAQPWHCDYEKFHPHVMRLPDAFQPKAEKCGCGPFLHECNITKPDPVESAIREVMYSVTEHGNVALEGQLRELVELARKTK